MDPEFYRQQAGACFVVRIRGGDLEVCPHIPQKSLIVAFETFVANMRAAVANHEDVPLYDLHAKNSAGTTIVTVQRKDQVPINKLSITVDRLLYQDGQMYLSDDATGPGAQCTTGPVELGGEPSVEYQLCLTEVFIRGCRIASVRRAMRGLLGAKWEDPVAHELLGEILLAAAGSGDHALKEAGERFLVTDYRKLRTA